MMACDYCSMKPEFRFDHWTGQKEFTGEWDNEIKIADGAWTAMYFGVDADGRFRLTASGDGRADYYPKFCPECGRRVNDA